NDWFQPGSGVIGVATYEIGNYDSSNYGFAFVEELSIYYNYSGGELINFSEYLANLVSHEAAHTFGANHVDDPSALMNPYLSLSPRRTMWGSGSIPGSSYEQDSQSLLGENLGYLNGVDDYGDNLYVSESVAQNSIIDGLLERRDDIDVFTFTATESGSIDIEISTTEYGNLDSFLKIYRNSDLTLIAENDDFEGGRDSAVTFDGIAGEDYSVYVSSYDSNSSGSYVLAIDPAPEVPVPDIAITDSLGVEDDLTMDFGSITVNTTASATFTITNNGTADLVVSELSVDGVYELDLVSLPGDSGDDLVIAAGSEQIVEVTFNPEQNETYPATITVVSNDEDQFLITLEVSGSGQPPQPNIYVPESMDLGEVIRNETISDTLMIYNNGEEDLVVSYVDISSPFDLGDGLGAPTVTIIPGSYFELDVSVTPTQRGPQEGQISILSNDPDQSVISVDLFVQSLAGLLSVEESAQTVNDSQIDFGPVYVDNTAENTVALTNTGDADLTVTGLEVDDGFSLSMDLDQMSGGDDVILAPGSSLFFDVIYSPAELESAEGTVTIYTNDTEIPENYVQLEATGIGGILQVTELDGINDAAIHYDNIEAGQSHWVNPWSLTNNGNASITVFLDMDNNTDFQLLSPESVTLLPGASYMVNVMIQTNLARQVTDTLTLAANDLDSSYQELSLSADVSALVTSDASYQFTDHSGDLVTISLKGGAEARVVIGNTEGSDIASIELLTGTAADTLAIKVKGE
ncbi:MAG: choice-of-anchor D domain-containing protein, partial [Planctomycetes bacterium]|nr:choice-of-anchor D domain-containing protein [Planctomycetota bacterium]